VRHELGETRGVEPMHAGRVRLELKKVSARREDVQVAPVQRLSRRSTSEAPQAEAPQDRGQADVDCDGTQESAADGELDVADAGQPLAGKIEDLVVEDVLHQEELVVRPGPRRQRLVPRQLDVSLPKARNGAP